MNKQIVYYTCNQHPPEIDEMCRAQLVRGGLPIISVSLNKPLKFGDVPIFMQGERSPLMMHRQILAGLQATEPGLVFLCESDVLYHPSHFEYPAEKLEQIFSYNCNVWRLRWSDGLAVWTDDLQQVSGICAPRELLIDFYLRRVMQIQHEGFNRHYEPGVKQSVGGRTVINRMSTFPNICIRHDNNLTKSKWSPDEFRNKNYAKGWRTSHTIPGWVQDGNTWRTK